MRSVLTFVTRGRVHAITTCAVCSVMSLLLFPLSYVSGALVGLVTLRSGMMEGAFVLLGSLVLGSAFMYVAIETPRPAGLLALLTWVPVWLLAALLRRTHSQGVALAGGGLVLAVAVVIVRMLLGDPAEWWRQVLSNLFEWLAVSGDFSDFVERLAPLMTGVVAAGTLLGLVVTLMLSRWSHAVLDNPGGFGEEFRSLRMPMVFGYAAPLLAALAWLADGALADLAYEWLMLLLVLFGLQGISLAHHVVKARNASIAWLVALYGALVVLPQPSATVALGLALVGISDSWLDYRRRFGAGRNLRAGD